jgi:hypothetical protein
VQLDKPYTHSLPGFQLLDKHEFVKMVYPGCAPDTLSSISGPKTFQELLADEEYQRELVLLVPEVQRKADTVLENVKRRGAVEVFGDSPQL